MFRASYETKRLWCKTKKIFYFLPAILWASVMFYFSSQVAAVSNLNNSAVIIFLDKFGINLINIFGNQTSNFIIRKAAHISEYLILFLLIYFGFYKNKTKNRLIYSSICLILYSISDEVHQVFVPGRAGKIADVCIDSIGMFMGIIIVLLIHNRTKES